MTLIRLTVDKNTCQFLDSVSDLEHAYHYSMAYAPSDRTLVVNMFIGGLFVFTVTYDVARHLIKDIRTSRDYYNSPSIDCWTSCFDKDLKSLNMHKRDITGAFNKHFLIQNDVPYFE